MKKKIISALLCASILSPAAYASFPDVSSGDYFGCEAENLYSYGVLNGDENGNFNPYDTVTRAQFAKMATVICKLSPRGSGGGLFRDLPDGYWANGYIAAAAKSKLLSGYPDGSFRPDEGITFAEAATITLRLLDYTPADLGNSYPDAYIRKAAELGLSDGMSLAANDRISRADTAVMLDRALLCDMNGQSRKLITKMNYSVSDECIILAVADGENDLLSDEISTSLGKYKTTRQTSSDLVGIKARLVIDSDSRVVGISEIAAKHTQMAIESIAGTDITYRENGVLQSYSVNPNAAVYYNSQLMTYNDAKSYITVGSVLDVFFTAGGSYDYAILSKYKMKGPRVLYTDADKTALGTPSRVVRDGYASDLSKLQTYDVLYFDEKTGTLYAYCDKVTGVYEKALPSKANISSIVLSGTEYPLESKLAITALGEYDGAYAINAGITCLLGKDGGIAAVVHGTTAGTQYGVLLSCESKIVDGTKKWYVTCLSSNGTTQQFETKGDESSNRGKIMSYRFENGLLKPTYVNSNSNKVSGGVVTAANAIGQYTLAADCKVIDVGYKPKATDDNNAVAAVIEFSDIRRKTLDDSDILYSAVDGDKITALFLNNVTKPAHSFGLVKTVVAQNSSNVYTLDIGGSEQTYTTDFRLADTGRNTPVAALIVNSRLIGMERLVRISANGALTALDKTSVTVGSSVYSVAKNAAFYVNDNSTYKLISPDDVELSEISGVSLYSDTQAYRGGQIRVVVLTKKK